MEYTVSLSYSGTMDIEVEADNEAEALEIAMDEYSLAAIDYIEIDGYTIEEL